MTPTSPAPDISLPRPASPALAAFARHGWQWLVRVDATDPLRRALNGSLAVVLMAVISFAVVFLGFTIMLGDIQKMVIVSIALPIHILAWWLNRRGTEHGAWAETVVMAASMAAGVATFGPELIEGAVPLALALPVMVATLFIRPSAGFWIVLFEVLALAAALSFVSVPLEQASRFLISCFIVLSVVAIFLFAGASIVWNALRRSIEANALLQNENAERKRAEERLLYLVHHDMLTSLPNRTLLRDHLDLAMHEARRHGSVVGVLLLDVDRFKTINDSLGHAIGDMLLKAVGDRLVKCLRPGDTVARIGGDEYAIVLTSVHQPDDISVLAGRLIDCFVRSFEVGDHALYVTGSIGIALYPGDGKDTEELLRNADVAMYRAKELGHNNYQFYTAEMTARAQHRLTVEHDLRRALENDQFVLHYHPVIELQTRKVIAAEALLRWDHPRHGRLMPSGFISVAEDSGLILPLGEWVLRTACRQHIACRARGVAPVRVILNLSARQFQQKTLVDDLAVMLRDTGVDPGTITLEITESTLMDPEANTEPMLQRLHEMGVRISVDDFGTGYSSLAYLKRFPISVLKIDRSFVDGIGHDHNDEAIVTAIIAMARSLHIQVVAEGVETEQQLEFLVRHGCNAVQGFIFHRPMPADELIELLKEGKE